MPPPIAVAEIQRGTMACVRYARRVCQCAQSGVAGLESCSLAQSRPQSLAAVVEILAAGEDDKGLLGSKDVRAAQAAARKLMAACFDAEARLNPVECPRLGAERSVVGQHPESATGVLREPHP